MTYADERTAAFRKTLDRLPDEIALAIGLHVFDETALGYGPSCVCGWAAREAFARETGTDPDSESASSEAGFASFRRCWSRFGGDEQEWINVWNGVTDCRAPLIEEALFDRVMAAATASARKVRRSALRQAKP